MTKLTGIRKPLVVLLLFEVFGHSRSKGVPSFRIVAPQTICEKSSDQLSSNQPQIITISFYPRNGERLRYKFQIFFKLLGNYRSQRRTLELWKSVRSLEQRINARDQNQISERNLLTINKTEFMSGVAYIFHVVGTTSKGIVSKSQNFTIKYLGAMARKNDSNVSFGMNLLLLGTEYTLSSIPFVLVAKVSHCRLRFDYYFRWNIPELDEEFQKYLRTPKSVLRIPEGVLKAGREYQVDATILQSNTSQKLAQNSFFVRVLKRRFKLHIFPTSMTTGLKQPVNIEIQINDYDGDNFLFQIEWKATDPSGREQLCKNCDSTNSTRLQTSFETLGRYTVIAKVTKNKSFRTISCEIKVEPHLLVFYDFENVPRLSITKGQEFHLTLFIRNLIPNCEGEWTTVSKDGFETFRKSDISLGSFKINDIQKNYLSELSDFDNSIVSKEALLKVPQSSKEFEGFNGDSRYKFRMTVTCPSLFLNESNQTEEDTTSFFEFNIATNSPPQGGPLEVKPNNGFALQTVFQFITGDAKTIETNTPLSYEFLYKVDNRTISIGTYYEFRATDTILPYSESLIETMYKVCDIHLACTMIEGPKVTVKIGNISLDDVQQKQQDIASSFQRKDFYNGQSLMLLCALTYQKLDNQDIYSEFKSFSTNLLSREIDKQYERPTDKIYFSTEDMYKFIKLTKQNFEALDIMNTEMIRKLLDLLESAAEEREYSENIELRKKRDVGAPEDATGRIVVDSDFATLSLQLVERLWNSLDENEKDAEKATILEKVSQLKVKMCKSNETTTEHIETDLITLRIWKMPGNKINGKKFLVNDNKISAGYFILNLPELENTKKICVTWVKFREDHLSGQPNAPIYGIELYDDSFGSFGKEISGDGSSVVELALPLKKKTGKCLMWSGNRWSPDECKSNIDDEQALCKCQRLGYIKLGDVANEAIFSTTIITNYHSHAVTSLIVSEHNPQSHTTLSSSDDSRNSISITFPITTSTTSPLSANTTRTSSIVNAASLIDYLLPFICILSIALIIGGLVLYQKRRKIKEQNLMKEIEIVEPRELNPGIKYGKFYDEHLLNGNI